MSESVHEHYRLLLLLPKPWLVTEVVEELDKEKVSVQVAWPKRSKAPCPECGKLAPVHDRLPERSWRHLSVMQYRLELRCSLPRCNCPEHGVKAIATPWAEPRSRHTLHFESWTIRVIQACGSLSQACELLDLHWDSAQRIVNRAVERGLARRSLEGLEAVGLDEKNFLKGQSYVSLMTDLKGSRVLEVVRDRKTTSVVKLWEALPEGVRKEVVAAAMDMGQPFILGTKKAAPHVDIVHDRFHVSKSLNEAVDKTRRQECAQLAKNNDDTLKGTRYLWLHGNTPEKSKQRFEDLLEVNLKTAKAWLYKEQMVEFWEHSDAQSASEFFGHWYRSVMSSRLPAVKNVAKSLKEHLSDLLTYFTHRITNAMTEGFNSRIQAIKASARGFRSFDNYRSRILFFCGKLDMQPTIETTTIHS